MGCVFALEDVEDVEDVAEDYTDFAGETHAAFDLDPVRLEAPDDIAAARDLEDW